MSVESMAIALHHSQAKGTAKVVLIGIANHDGDGGAWPSKATLAKYANVDVSNVKNAIKWLEKHREIRVERQSGGTANMPDYLRPNRYHFLLECPAWCDRSRQHRDTRKHARYVPRYLDIEVETAPPGEITPGGDSTPRPPVRAPGGPPVETPPEPHLEQPENPPSSYEVDASARAGSKANEERSAPTPEPQPQPSVTPCKRFKFMPCSYSPTTHRCLSCDSLDPRYGDVQVDPATGEVHDEQGGGHALAG